VAERVWLLAPFDPVVWDRRRFKLWGWAYRFEAYTPAPKRVRGNYAPREAAFRRALEAGLDAMRRFLGVSSIG